MNNFIKNIVIVFAVIVGIFLLLYYMGGFFVEKLSPSLSVTSSQSENLTSKAILGKSAPYFNLLSLSGGRVNPSDFTGKASVFIFWSTWNQESVDQIKIVDDYLTHHNSEKDNSIVNIVGIDSQEQEVAVANFMRRGGYNVSVLVDPTGETTNSYGVQTLPTTFFVDREGNIEEIFIGTLSEAMLVDKIEKILR